MYSGNPQAAVVRSLTSHGGKCPRFATGKHRRKTARALLGVPPLGEWSSLLGRLSGVPVCAAQRQAPKMSCPVLVAGTSLVPSIVAPRAPARRQVADQC